MRELTPRHIEQLEILAGTRVQSRVDAAVRVTDLLPLLQLRPQLKSAPAAGATPTKAEYDALRGDLEATNSRLLEIAAVLQKAVQGR